MMQNVNVVSISGGKDSTALWLLAKERGVEVETIFADTGHEHPETYKYIEYLEKELGPIRIIKPDFTERIKKKRETVQTKWRKDGVPEERIERALEVLHPTGIPFLDLVLWKGRFPSTKARFCTQELKIIPIMEQVYEPYQEQGKKIISWQGVRADESAARSKLVEREEVPEGYEVYRPILKWTADDVFAMHRKHGIEPNPLYKQGMMRVGCMPCIHSGKAEIFEIARRYPEELERVAEWERIASKAAKQGRTTFFSENKIKGSGIRDVIDWSMTSHGGLQYDLEKAIEFENVPACSSHYGLCE